MATANALNAPIPFTGTNGGTGINNGSSTLTYGGNVTFTGAFTTAFTITGNTSVTLPTSGTLATTAQAVLPVDQTSSSVTMAANTRYITDNGASLVTYTLPTTAAIGAVVEIIGKSAGLWTIAQAAGQSIRIGSATSSTGVGGSVSATLLSDCVRLVCITANTVWTSTSVQGNLTVV